MKRRLKQIKSAASALMTIASAIVLILAMCTVHIEKITWLPIVIYFVALAWIAYVMKKLGDKGGKAYAKNR